MRKNGSQSIASPNGLRGRKTTTSRLIIVAVSLLAIGAGIILLFGRNSQAAPPTLQQGKTSKDGLWQDVAGN